VLVKRFASAGDIAMPVKIESGPKAKTTADKKAWREVDKSVSVLIYCVSTLTD